MRLSRFALLAPLLLAALAFNSVPALAAVNHPFNNASETLPNEDACGLAGSGASLYVSSYDQDKIYMPSGSLAPESTVSGPCKLELDATGDLYVNNWHANVVKYNSSELLPGQGTVIDSAHPTGLAVQQSSGDLYVAHRTYISKYDTTGTLLETIGSGGLKEAYGVAVSEYPATAGDIYVPDAATHSIKVFGPTGNPISEMNGEATPQGGFTYLRDGEIVIDNNPLSPSFGHIFVLDAIGHGESVHPEGAIDEFNAEGDYRGQVTGFVDAEPSGLILDGTTHNLYLTSGNSEGSQVFEYGPTAPAKTLKAVKEGGGGGTLVSAPAGIACGGACTAEFNENQTVTVFPLSNAHSNFSGWSVTGAEPCPGTGSCTVQMANDVEIKASFTEPPQQTLTVTSSGEGNVVSSPAAISCPVNCSEHFAQGRLVTLTALPGAHQKLIGWSGCESLPSPSECKVTMAEAKTVSVTFAPIPQISLDLSLSGTGQGTVTSFPSGISCPGNCSGSFDEGSIVYLMAAPSPGSGFGGFSGGGCEGTAPLCAVTLSSATEVRAQFNGTAAGPAQAAARSSFSLVAVRTAGTRALLTVRASEAGTLLLSGPGLRPAKREVSAGTSRVRVGLDRRASSALFAHHRLRLRLAIGFLPAGGGPPAATTAALRFRFPAGKAPRRQH